MVINLIPRTMHHVHMDPGQRVVRRDVSAAGRKFLEKEDWVRKDRVGLGG